MQSCGQLHTINSPTEPVNMSSSQDLTELRYPSERTRSRDGLLLGVAPTIASRIHLRCSRAAFFMSSALAGTFSLLFAFCGVQRKIEGKITNDRDARVGKECESRKAK